MTFAEKVLHFNRNLSLPDSLLPEGIRAMNPFNDPEVIRITEEFYRKYYSDNNERYFIIGINPGRFGAGVTGIPFTDTKRLSSELGISYKGTPTHEPSSVFVYDVISAYGGPEKFFGRFYINSICPLGFVMKKKEREVNFNYYDVPALLRAVKPFMIKKLKEQTGFGINREKAFCLGTGKNFKHLCEINKESQLFKEIIPLAHPRYIVQYKSRNKQQYVEDYLKALSD
jgi:hypothetical protein